MMVCGLGEPELFLPQKSLDYEFVSRRQNLYKMNMAGLVFGVGIRNSSTRHYHTPILYQSIRL